MVYVANILPSKAKYSLTYIDNAKVTLLRENHPIKDRLTEGQEKYYKVAALGEGVKGVRVHLVQISGKSNILAFNKDPREAEEGKQLVPWKTAEHNTIVLTEELHQPIFIVVHGDDNSFFAVTLSLVRQANITLDREVRDHFNIFVIPEHSEQ